MKEAQSASPTRNWATTLMFVLTFAVAVTAVPWYGFTHGYNAAAWVCFALLLGANGMAITCGYHRLFAHCAYEARSALKLAYLLFGAMALQSSALNWGADHRAHHRYIDDPERDPYCARRGFCLAAIKTKAVVLANHNLVVVSGRLIQIGTECSARKIQAIIEGQRAGGAHSAAGDYAAEVCVSKESSHMTSAAERLLCVQGLN